jgi:PAS domain-containing protein
MTRMSHSDSDRKATTGCAQPDFAASLMASGASCALVDRDGKIVDASQALKLAIPHVLGKSIEEIFRVEFESLVSKRNAYHVVDGIYTNAANELVPARLQTLRELPDSGYLLVLVTDGAPFRRAERERFESTSFAIMRVRPDGVVTFANAETYRALSWKAEDVIGRPFRSLFSESNAASIDEGLARCLTSNKPVPLAISVTRADHTCDDALALLLTPDIAPDRRPLGALVLVRSSLVERVRDDIARLALDLSIQSWETRLGLILQQVHRLFDFDHAIFGMYDDKVSFFRAFVIFPHDRLKWTERWLELPPGIRNDLESGKMLVKDSRDLIKQYPRLADSEVVRMYESKHIRSSVTLVAVGADGPTSALSVCSKKVGGFDQTHLDWLRDLHLEPVLIRIEEEIAAQRLALRTRLRNELAAATCLPKAARKLIDEIAVGFHWDYVALFRVDRQNDCFELFHQNRCKDRFRLEDTYRQPIGDGMLGATLREKAPLIVNDIGAPDVEQHGYLSRGRKMRSTMTIPVRLNRRIRWILNIETEVTHAFHGPDEEAILQLVAELESELNRHTTDEINRMVLRETEQGVVTVGMEGAILEMNSAAERLLGRTEPLSPDGRPVYLCDYTSSDDRRAKEILKGLTATEKRHIELKGDDEQIRPVLATRRVLEASFDTALWFFVDVRSDRWTLDSRFLREIVSDVAQQTRAPLALASNLARKLPKLWCAAESNAVATPSTDTTAEKMSRRLLAEIGKVDITFERLAEGLAIRREPLRKSRLTEIDLWCCVDAVVRALPERDQDCVTPEAPATSVLVKGDAERLIFVFRSVLAHLLRVRPDDEAARVKVALARAGSNAVLTLALTSFVPARESAAQRADTMREIDNVWVAYKTARGDASLSLDVVTSVVEAHDGRIETQAAQRAPNDPSPPWMAFQITLPTLTAGANS